MQTVPAQPMSTESSALRVLYTYIYKTSKQLKIATTSCFWEVNSVAGFPFSIAQGWFTGSWRCLGRKALGQAPN